MRKRISCLLAALLLLAAFGCGGDKDKGINSNKDKPRAADKAG